jgi:hypothetical protein
MLDADDVRMDDHQYFTAVRYEAANGGLKAMLHTLLLIELSRFNTRQVPRTAALREQQLHSAPTTVRWAADLVQSGELLPADHHRGVDAVPLPARGFTQEIDGALLYGVYTGWCRTMRERPEASTAFGRWMSRCGVPARASNGSRYRNMPDGWTLIAAVFKDAGII